MSGPQLNIIASILELLKIFTEVIVASKCDPLARIEKQGYVKKNCLCPQLKIKNQIMGYRWTFGKIRENFVSDPQLNMI